MTLILSIVAAVFFAVLVGGWLLLVGSIAFTAVATVAGPPLLGVGLVARWWRESHAEPTPGVLVLHGLEATEQSRVRGELARVLRLAPERSRPRACGCVMESGGGFVGVLRVFNQRGHYLLRTRAATAAAVAEGLIGELRGFTESFPARPGTRRVSCPECNRSVCPLIRAARERALAPAAA